MSTSNPDSGDAAAPRRDVYHHGNLRQALVLAARDLLRSGGLAAVTLREAARRAGVSHNAPYRHFESREALLAAISAAGFNELRDRLTAAAQGAAEGQRLHGLGRAYVRFALENRSEFHLMFGQTLRATAHPELAEAATAALGVLRQTVADSSPSIAAEETSTLRAWATAHGLAHLVAEGQLGLEAALDVLSPKDP